MFSQQRRGLPNLAGKLARGDAAHIVAYGSSMTYAGYYLESVVDRVAHAFGATIALTRRGLRGAGSTHAAHYLDRQLLPLAPDLVLVEFSVNDDFFTPDSLEATVHGALHAIVGRIRARYPTCDIAFVHFAFPAGTPGTSNLAIPAYESLAAQYGIASFDLDALSKRLVASGRATWNDSPRALLRDGPHHTRLAAELLGLPFADALVATIAAGGTTLATPTVTGNAYDRAQSAGIGTLTGGAAHWTVAPVEGELAHLSHSATVIDEMAIAVAPGAAFPFAFRGNGLVLSVLTRGGSLALRTSDSEATIDIPAEPQPRFLQTRIPLPEGDHRFDIVALRAPIALGDVFYFGERVE